MDWHISNVTGWGILSGLCGMSVTLIFTPLVRRWAVKGNLLDKMGQFHSTHTLAIPRLGGLALVLSFCVIFSGILIFHPKAVPVPDEVWVIFAGSMAMFAVGFRDDLRSVGAKIKFALQIVIATLTYLGGLQIGQWTNPFTHVTRHLGLLDFPLTVFWLISVTNLINLTDGIDGLAAGLSLMLMFLLAVVSGSRDGFFSMFLALGMAGALLAFLFYNFPPAKIFMGDGGAYFLGFLIGALSLYNANKGTVAVAMIAPFFALGLPIIDASFTLFRRGLRGLPFFRPDRKHIHHRLAAMGFSQYHVVWMLYAVCAFFLLMALVILVSKGQFLPVLLGLFMFGMVLSARLFGFVEDWYKLGRLLTNAIQRRKEIQYGVLLGQWLEMEAERQEKWDEMQKNFALVAQKLGFCEMNLQCPLGNQHWRSPLLFNSTKPIRYELGGAFFLTIEFHGPEKMDEETFGLLTELAAEGILKSAKRWQARKTVDKGS